MKLGIKCQFVEEWDCLVYDTLGRDYDLPLEKCRFCFESRKQWITFIDPIIRRTNEVERENSELKAKLKETQKNELQKP